MPHVLIVDDDASTREALSAIAPAARANDLATLADLRAQIPTLPLEGLDQRAAQTQERSFWQRAGDALGSVEAARRVLAGTRSVLLARADELEGLLRLSLGDLRSPAELASRLPAVCRLSALSHIMSSAFWAMPIVRMAW